ncbi:MAG: hypothetical protein KBD90_05475 [Alphaproteobacteria bacterium]|nr:hypothetical protein [Alphaproteobacteria bacterium]
MLNIIEPKDHKTNQKRIDSFLDLLKVYQSFSIPTEELENATFAIASDNEYGVYGGALLLKKSVWDLELGIRQMILTARPDMDEVWTGIVGYYKEHEGAFSGKQALEVYLDFYCNLLDVFNDFGDEKQINFLFLTLSKFEYLKTTNHELWEYVYTVLPEESSDGLFHGILTLDGREE